jgi:hypothetical protein
MHTNIVVRWTCTCILHQVIVSFHMTAKNMDVTRINLLHKIWCNIQKNDNMMATMYCIHFTVFFRGKVMFRKKSQYLKIPVLRSEKNGIIPVSVLTIQYRIGNTTRQPTRFLNSGSFQEENQWP